MAVGKRKICPRKKVRITLAYLPVNDNTLYYIWCTERGIPTWKKVTPSGRVEFVGNAITYDRLMENIRNGSYILYTDLIPVGG